MKKLIFALLTLISVISLNAWNGSGRGALLGGLGGAAIGGAAGGRTGAIAGGLTGAFVGSAIGASQDGYYDDGYDDVYYGAPVVYERPARVENNYNTVNTVTPSEQGTVLYVK